LAFDLSRVTKNIPFFGQLVLPTIVVAALVDRYRTYFGEIQRTPNRGIDCLAVCYRHKLAQGPLRLSPIWSFTALLVTRNLAQRKTHKHKSMIDAAKEWSGLSKRKE
jgi:hypothetical protein